MFLPVRKYASSACLSLYMRAGMEEAEAVDALVQRLKSDGYQVLENLKSDNLTATRQKLSDTTSPLSCSRPFSTSTRTSSSRTWTPFCPGWRSTRVGSSGLMLTSQTLSGFWSSCRGGASTLTPTSSSQKLLRATSRTAWGTRCRWAWTGGRR